MIRDDLSTFTFSEEKHKNVFYDKNEVDFLLNSLEQQNTALHQERANMQATHQSTISRLQARIKELEEKDRLKNCKECYDKVTLVFKMCGIEKEYQ